MNKFINALSSCAKVFRQEALKQAVRRSLLLYKYLWIGIAFILLVSTKAYALPFTYTFATLPDTGAVSATPGGVTGWGYKIVNEDPVNWLVIVALNADAFQYGTPDASIFDYPIVAPGNTASTAFDDLTNSGLFRFTWDAIVPSGFINTGAFSLSAEWWSDDPLGGGTFIQSASLLTAPYAVSVISGSTVPEPLPLWLLISLLPFVILRTNKKVFN